MDNPKNRKILLNRRDILSIIPGYVGVDRILSGRQKTNTLKAQIEIIKALWKINIQVGCLMYFHAPIVKYMSDWEEVDCGVPVQIIGMNLQLWIGMKKSAISIRL